MNPDQTAPPGSSLILVHIVCKIDTEVHKQKREQTTVENVEKGCRHQITS